MWLLLACTGADPDDSASSTAPEDLVATLTSPGPWNVGYRELSVDYAAPTGPRTLRLAAWYPTEADDGAAVVYGGFYPASDTILGDAPVAPGTFPLAVFSHGHQGYAENSSFLMAHLASHGHVVLAPDHTGNTTFDGADRSTEIYFERPLDISAVIDAAPGLAELGPAVADGPVLSIGHSFGGYTQLALAGGRYDLAVCPADIPFCSTMTAEWEALFAAGFAEPRIGAFGIMAGGDLDLFGAAGLTGLTHPFLHLTATEDQPEGSEADTMWEALRDGDDLRVVLDGGGHQSFTDFADVIEDVPLSAEESFRIVDAYTLAWAWRLGGDPRAEAVIAGEVAVSEAVELRR